MKITICSASDIIKFANEFGSGFSIISVMDNSDKQKVFKETGVDIDGFYSARENVLRLSFSDVMNGMYNAPTAKDIESAIEFAKGKSHLVVHCYAGISRSSALAYVIACSQMPVDHALKVLNLKVHCPNMFVVELGSQILGNKKMVKRLDRECSKCYECWERSL